MPLLRKALLVSILAAATTAVIVRSYQARPAGDSGCYRHLFAWHAASKYPL